MAAFAVDISRTRDLSADLLDGGGRLRVVDASYYANTTVFDRAVFGVQQAAYVLPTTELVSHLHHVINGRSVIEIGSGNGALAKALGIQATDSHMQDDPAIAFYYASMGQPTVRYGGNVDRLDAMAAIAKYRPKVVLAAWITHVYDPTRPQAEGNMLGVDEEKVIDMCETYLFIGNRKVHEGKPIWRLPHKIIEPSWLYSRAMTSSDFIAAWGDTRGLL